MLGETGGHLAIGLAAVLCVVGIVSFAVAYFIPAMPTTVTIATAFKGSTFVYYGEKYREIFARIQSYGDNYMDDNAAAPNVRYRDGYGARS